MKEFYKKYRPKTLEVVIGQDSAVSMLSSFLQKENMPQAILFSGPSGTGKTTLARILKREMLCDDADFVEMNCSDFRGVDTIREIRQLVGLRPMAGPCRIWLIDECHKLTNDAQDAFLKMLEDTPKHAFFMLATTNPGKLLRTMINRLTEVRLQPLSVRDLRKVLERVVNKEKLEVSSEVLDEICAASEGSPRKALVILGQVATVSGDDEQMKAITAATVNKEAAISLARALIKPNSRWDEVAAILKEMNDEPESVRYLVLGYSRTVMLGGGPLAQRAFKIIDIFGRNFYDSKQAGLAAACWEVVH